MRNPSELTTGMKANHDVLGGDPAEQGDCLGPRRHIGLWFPLESPPDPVKTPVLELGKQCWRH
jgi:hypothetical protein